MLFLNQRNIGSSSKGVRGTATYPLGRSCYGFAGLAVEGDDAGERGLAALELPGKAADDQRFWSNLLCIHGCANVIVCHPS
jgi:hypothetical protein